MVKKVVAFCGSRKFSTVFTINHQWFLSWQRLNPIVSLCTICSSTSALGTASYLCPTNFQLQFCKMNIAIFWDIPSCSSSETSVHIRTTRRYIPEDGNIRNYRWENLKSCITFCTLNIFLGVRGSVAVKALCYKPEGLGFETRFAYLFGRIRPWGSLSL
jgi:hypothetical protein